MRAEDLRLEEMLVFKEGAIDLHGRRLVLHSVDAFAQFRKDLVEMAGAARARRILTRFAYFWGQADAAAMKRIFTWDTPTEWLLAGPRMHSLQGVTRAVVKRLEPGEGGAAFEMEVLWHDSGEAEEHALALGRAEEPVCWMLAGYASGYASFCLGRPVYFVERKCRACGDAVCLAVGKDAAGWGDELKPHLPYFAAEDIEGRILALTEELRRKTREIDRQRRRLEEVGAAPGAAGFVEVRSPAFARVVELASRAAPYDSSILITGESGVGKEVLARHIHRLSGRTGPFVALNCGALPETLLESELFGHKAGAFTGATHDRAGLFEEAGGGALFLDEIGDVSPAMQLKLLRAVQEREIVRLGENRPRKVDVRMIAATNRPLARLVREGRFREDLYYRLAVIEIEVPPLRERREDILPLARHFVERMGRKLKIARLRLDGRCADVLNAYSWPGNIRELQNAVERAAVLCRDALIRPEDLPPAVVRNPSADSAAQTLAEAERAHILAVLKQCGDNRTLAAKRLGIGPATLWRKLKSYETQG